VSEPILIDAINAEKARDEEPTVLTVPLAQRYGFPPFSVIDRRSGHWQKRKRRWNDIGLTSVKGRDEALLGGYVALHAMNPEQYKTLTATSIFDPCLCELAYDWFSPPGGNVLDPFAGGSVRGIVASHLGRPYTGIDLRPEQVQANEDQRHMADPACPPRWVCGDSAEVLSHPGQHALLGRAAYDFVFSCPPYFDLEGYSTGDKDLSGMTYGQFLDVYSRIIALAVDRLRPDRFAAWVISDVRDPKGYYRGLVADSIKAFEAAGAHLYNDIIITDPVGSVAVRAARPFDSSRKVARLHQHMLVFVKGDPKRASADLNIAIEQDAGTSALPSGDTLF
jgi:hypothetical protein